MADSAMDFSVRCRLCIEPKRLSIDIFSEEGRRIKLRSKINKHLSLKISQSDRLPRQICYQCLFRLETWVSFKQLCLERDQVMKTWSQSCIDEASCGVEETFNGGQSNCKGVKIHKSGASQSSRSHTYARDTGGSNDIYRPLHQMDDAKSDSSLWEVVKVDDTENVECDIQRKDIASSSPGYCAVTGNITTEKQDWNNRRKSRKPNKVGSSGSDSSNSNDVDTQCSVLLGHPVDSVLSTLSDSTCFKRSTNSQEIFSRGASTPPLKRKRGRPSKASLQRERELKKSRGQEKTNADPLLHEHVGNQSTESEKEILIDDDGTVESEPTHISRPHVITPEFTPIERDDGSGVTEVVLDDPDFGSMKFTLSVVDVESPMSSPIPADSFKYYSYPSSCGNASTDSLHREDFEGFESPGSSCFMKPSLKDDSGSLSDEMPRSRSHDDVRSTELDIIPLPAGIERRRSNSVSVDTREACSLSDSIVAGQEEPLKDDVNNSSQCAAKLTQVSRSLESINIPHGENHCSDSLEDRNAYSDGELSETANSQFRRKLSFSKTQQQVKLVVPLLI